MEYGLTPVAIAALCATLSACSHDDDGAVWAKKSFGEVDSAALLTEAAQRARPAAPPTNATPPYAPRPFVVLEDREAKESDKSARLGYHAVNPKLPPGVVAFSPSGVKSFIVLAPISHTADPASGASERKAVIVLRGGEGRFSVSLPVSESDLVRAILALPEAPP